MSILSGRARAALLSITLLAAGAVQAAERTAGETDSARLRAWVEEMKQAPRGPFTRIRWFCADGTVLPPKAYACKDHGGGVQHGELNERAVELRERGYYVANVLADVDAEALLARDDHREQLAQMLVERFLVRADDGWILRKARFYRGAFQDEDERAGARRLLLALLSSDDHLTRDFVLVRTAARALPHGADGRSADVVRQLSASLSDRDRDFLALRNKIHGRPEPPDAASVRRYASGVTDPELKADFEKLALAIDDLFAASSSTAALRALATQAPAGSVLARRANEYATQLEAASGDVARYVTLARALEAFRDLLGQVGSAENRLIVMDTSLGLEADLFVAASALARGIPQTSRAARVALLSAGMQAAYGTGLISPRQREALRTSAALLEQPRPTLDQYKGELDYLALLPTWGAQRLRYQYGAAMHRLSELEPKAAHFIEDQLRGSPLLFYARVLDRLLRDANTLAGVRNELFGENVGSGLRALNPGLARGQLLPAPDSARAFAENGIYILPETTSDLPPVAGILTAGEGNPLSHVQLLARNLGIPNVGVDDSLLPRLKPHHERPVILAVSAAGSVRLKEDTGEGDRLFGAGAQPERQVLIRPDLQKLDVSEQRLLSLSALRAEDSGRTVGPKAAKLGELKSSFPEAVEEGLAIPFGVFRSMLDQPHPDGGSVFQWMQGSYRRLEAMPEGSTHRRAATERFRAALYDWVLTADPGDAFRALLRRRMQEIFGADGSYGVFVRSDTNVEDLPGFTGAGLNLTVPNVVGVDAVTRALSRVWASPFTARAFAWRQAHMEGPEHVYPAVLLLKSVNVEKSGVMVTRDIDSGARDWLSVATNEGVGGAVDGQAAESLRIDTATGRVRLMAQATASVRRQIDPRGGVDKVPTSGRDYVLMPDEISQLIELYRALPQRFPAIIDADGTAAPADIEFGFLGGELKLFQIRPFLESRRARGNAYLNALDAGLQNLHAVTVDMSAVLR